MGENYSILFNRVRRAPRRSTSCGDRVLPGFDGVGRDGPTPSKRCVKFTHRFLATFCDESAASFNREKMLAILTQKLRFIFSMFIFVHFSTQTDPTRTVQRSALCKSRRELSNEYLLANIGVDAAENEPRKVWRIGVKSAPSWKSGA